MLSQVACASHHQYSLPTHLSFSFSAANLQWWVFLSLAREMEDENMFFMSHEETSFVTFFFLMELFLFIYNKDETV